MAAHTPKSGALGSLHRWTLVLVDDSRPYHQQVHLFEMSASVHPVLTIRERRDALATTMTRGDRNWVPPVVFDAKQFHLRVWGENVTILDVMTNAKDAFVTLDNGEFDSKRHERTDCATYYLRSSRFQEAGD